MKTSQIMLYGAIWATVGGIVGWFGMSLTDNEGLASLIGWVLGIGGYAFAVMNLWHVVQTVSIQRGGMNMMREDPKRFAELAHQYEQARRSHVLTENDVGALDLGKYFYLMKYREHYAVLLDGVENEQKILSELFLFRGWTTQFGFRIFNSERHLVDPIVSRVVNEGKYLGAGIFASAHGFSPTEELGADFMDLIEDRWRTYDMEVEMQTSPSIPTLAICGKALDYCELANPIKTVALSTDFLDHLHGIKKEAIQIGLLQAP